MQDSKLLGLACCWLCNKPQCSAFNHVWFVMIMDEMHNAEYWRFLETYMGVREILTEHLQVCIVHDQIHESTSKVIMYCLFI